MKVKMTIKTEKTTIQNVKQKKEPFIYGYKALDKNLCASMGNGMQFEAGKTYEVEGKLEFCKNGFHFCKRLEDTLNYYDPFEELRFIKIEAYKEILPDRMSSKLICRKIKVVKELSKQDILRALSLDKNTLTEAEILGKTPETRGLLALKGFFLNILIDDEDWRVRVAVAEQGYSLDVLINDEKWKVRRAVAEQGYGLDILINDKELCVRAAVAEQGYGLDVLINDESWFVRCAVAEQGYGMDVLVNDENWRVRQAVAEQGYGLDILVHDEHMSVRSVVYRHLVNANEEKNATN